MSKTAIITGGSRGIGFAIAQQLGKDGYNIVITASGSKQKYTENLDELNKNSIPHVYVQADISKSYDRLSCFNRALDAFGGVDVLVNSAGVAQKVRADLLEMTEESFDHVLSINLKGLLFFTQLVANQMVKKQEGCIINISSLSAYAASVNRGEYCISKAGVSMVTSLFADRLAKEGILVYEVRPGIIATDMTSGVVQKYDALIEQGIFPIARWGRPQDVADAVSVLCSGKFSYSTGQVINVDGGFHIRRL
ncbi:MAG: 3-ketoacyl-ACP reductase [Christensenellales bacterium]